MLLASPTILRASNAMPQNGLAKRRDTLIEAKFAVLGHGKIHRQAGNSTIEGKSVVNRQDKLASISKTVPCFASTDVNWSMITVDVVVCPYHRN